MARLGYQPQERFEDHWLRERGVLGSVQDNGILTNECNNRPERKCDGSLQRSKLEGSPEVMLCRVGKDRIPFDTSGHGSHFSKMSRRTKYILWMNANWFNLTSILNLD